MKLTFVRKTAASGDSNCPALYRTDRGTFVVVGRIINDSMVLGQIRGMRVDEIAVEVPADVLAESTGGHTV